MPDAPSPELHTSVASFVPRAEADARVVVRFPVPWEEVGWGALVVTLGAMLLWLAVQVRPVSVPLLGSLAIAYILNPVVDRITRLGIHRALAIGLLMLSFLAAAVLFGIAVGPQIVHEAYEVPSKLRQVLTNLRPSIESIFNIELPHSVDSIVSTLQAQLAMHEETPYAAVAQKLTQGARMVFGGTVSALASLGVIAIVPLFTFYFLQDFHRLMATARTLCPLRWQAQLAILLAEIDGMLGSFVRGQILVGLILSVLYTLGFYLVGLPLALLVGIITGIGNMLPFVGTVIGLSLSLLFCLLSWHGFGQPMGVAAVFVVNHALESWLITPRIVGTSVGLSPFSVIVGVLVFGEMFGFVGILVAVPLTAVTKILARAFLRKYRASAFYRMIAVSDPALALGPDPLA